MPSGKRPDALRALEEAKRTSMARSEAATQETPAVDETLSIEEAFVQLVINCYASGVRVAMGVMPDGMAIFIRLAFPTASKDSHAGLVAFVVSDDPQVVLCKAVAALEAPPKPPWWKPDRFASERS